MAITCEQFGKAVVSAGLCSAEEMTAYWNGLPPDKRPPHGQAFAAALVKAGKLTPFQASETLAGRGRSLVLGDYVLLERIGAGGMGEVFKARHRHMDRLVALKIMSPQAMQDEAAVKRFQREVKAAARLEHPNIVTAFDAGHNRGIHYLVMQYVDGSDLSALVKQQGPLPVDLAIQCILQAARGLAYAHSEGIIHRDIKPANLLLDKKGVVKILDMGLARLDDASNEGLTGTEQVMGTVDYMSPEQAAGTHAVDARGDIYSLGCTLWFLLTGRKVYEGDVAMSRMLKHREAPIPSLCTAREGVTYDLEQIFHAMVAKRPEDRRASMKDVVRDLENLQATASGLSRLAASDDSSLNAFSELMQSLEQEATTVRKNAQTRTLTGLPSDAPTLEIRDGSVGTDPNSELSVKPLPKSRGGKRKPPNVQLIVTGIAGVLAVLIAVIAVVIMNQKGADAARKAAKPETDAGQDADATNAAGSAAKRRLGPSHAIAPFDGEQARSYQQSWATYLRVPLKQKNSIGMTMVVNPPGEFLMGSTPEQNALGVKMVEEAGEKPDSWAFVHLKEEMPQHRVELTKPFLMGMTEVTIGQFKKFVEATNYVTQAEEFGFGDSGKTTPDDTVTPEMKQRTWRAPGGPANEDSPVAQVTWNDAVMFCNWLSEQEGFNRCYQRDSKDNWILLGAANGYRLPTEAEWEFSCRAGTTTQFSFGDDVAELDRCGWYMKNGGGALAVALKPPNAFGLHDMHGNVSEWCSDYFGGNWYRQSSSSNPFGPVTGGGHVVRGGTRHTPAYGCRSAYRQPTGAPLTRGRNIGFRCVRTLDGPAAAGAATKPASAAEPGKITTPSDPVFQQWMQDVAALPAERQIEAVLKKLMELNPGFDGTMTATVWPYEPRIENGAVTAFGFSTDNVTDISPVRALAGLKILECDGSAAGKGKLSDLSPLAGMRLQQLSCRHNNVSNLSPLQGQPLTHLFCAATLVSDLSPLKGMPLVKVTCGGTRVTDLSPLQGMALTYLGCYNTQVSDLSPLKGMPLTGLNISSGTPVSDLSPLEGMPLTKLVMDRMPVSDLLPLRGMKLTEVSITPNNITKGLDVIRQMKSLKVIRIGAEEAEAFPPDEFWRKYDAGEFGKAASIR